MDPLTAAVVAIVQAAASDVVKTAVKDAYEGLKTLIRRRWGDAGPISAISALEKDPNSEAQVAVLEQKVGAVKATEDADVVQALNRLLEQMKTYGIESANKNQFNMSGGVVHGIAGANVTVHTINNYGAPPDNNGSRKTLADEEMAIIGGVWIDSHGSISQITQMGESFRFESMNRQTGLRSQGAGSVKGHRFNMVYQTNIPSTGTATGTVSADGLEISETVQDFVFGVFVATARKQ